MRNPVDVRVKPSHIAFRILSWKALYMDHRIEPLLTSHQLERLRRESWKRRVERPWARQERDPWPRTVA